MRLLVDFFASSTSMCRACPPSCPRLPAPSSSVLKITIVLRFVSYSTAGLHPKKNVYGSVHPRTGLCTPPG